MDALKRAKLRAARKEMRFPTAFAAELVCKSQVSKVTVGDISREGVLLSGTDLPVAGSAVTVLANGLTAKGTLAWKEGNKCGIRFEVPIDPLAIVRENALQYTKALRGRE